MRNIIIHISGCQGSGKTTIGNKLKDKYNEKIHTKDLDDLRNEFSQQKEITNYQEFINLFIEKHNDKPLILTGLTAEKCLGNMNNDDETFYVIDTKYKYFIDNDEVLKQRFFRQVSKLYERKEIFYEQWKKNNSDIQEKLFRFINLEQWLKNNIACRKIHKEHNYKFLDNDKIIRKVSKKIDSKQKYMKNYKIIKELGYGIRGSVYLVKNKKTKQKYAMKIEQVFEKDLEESLKSPIWREIDFADNMSSKYPQQFMKIYEYKNKKCNYVHNLSEKKWNALKDNKKQYKYYKELYASPYCSIKIVSIVDDTLHYIIYKIDDKKIVLDLFIQVVNIAYLINKEGYYHRDLYPTNIGVIFTKEKYIDILDKKILTHGYILSAIDYGMVLHKKYILDETEKDKLEHNNDLYPSLNRIIMRIMLRNLVNKYYSNIHKKVLITEEDTKKLDLENTKHFEYFQEILYKIVFFNKFQEQLEVSEKVKLFEFIPIESVKFIIRNFYDLKKILEHLIGLQY
jgi:shikimate kinase